MVSETQVRDDQEKVDVVIFGATGFTGERVLRVAIRKQQEDPNFTFKIAGRSVEKLRKVLQRCKDVAGLRDFKVDMIEADLASPESLRAMCEQAKVLINCVGPYRFYGEQVVKACVESGTNYVDISGEPQFLETMQLKYDQKAKEQGVYIVGSCGFDSIPSEMGIAFVKQSYGDTGDLESIESYMSLKAGPEGIAVHYGTWESAVHSIASAAELKPIRRELYKTRLPKSEHKVEEKILHATPYPTPGYAIPFPGSDRAVARRTEYLNYVEHQKRPVQISSYLNPGSAFNAVKIIICAVLFGLLAKFKFTRDLLLKYPKLFSLGVFSHEGPSEEQIKSTSFVLSLVGHGYIGAKLPATETHKEEPSKKIVVQVTGPEPGYAATSIFVFECAMVILKELQRTNPTIPRFGVLPPGYAFGDTDLIKQLGKRGIAFEVLYQGDEQDSNKKEL